MANYIHLSVQRWRVYRKYKLVALLLFYGLGIITGLVIGYIRG
jgi:hypothetical protein